MKLASTLAVMALSVPVPVTAGTIDRHANPENTQAIILRAVTVPADAEWLLLSGIVPLPVDPKVTDTAAAYGDTQTQTTSVLTRIKQSLEAQGYSMADIVRLTVYLVGDPSKGGTMDFAGMNAAYRQFFGTAENPNFVTRSTVQVAALAAPHLLVEIEATAARAPKPHQ